MIDVSWAQGKQLQVSSTQLHVHRDGFVCSYRFSPFGHDQRMPVQVCLVVDLLLCKSLLVTLDTGTWLSG